MASSVFFKFKSQKEPTRVEFDGTGISVFELKRDIIIKSGLGDGTDFDLAVYTDDGKEEYDDDTTIIPRSTTVIARRLPPMKPGAGRAARYVSGKMPVSAKNASRKEQAAKAASTKATSNAIAQMNSAMTEEEKMAAMFQAQTEQWSAQQEEMSHQQPVFKPGSKKTANVPDHEPPHGYICYRCGEKGHWIQQCPTNDNPDYDNRPRVKRTTGIPKSFLKTVDKATALAQHGEGDDSKTPSGIMVNADGEFVIAEPDKASWEQFQAKAKSTAAAQKDASEEDKEVQERGLECPVDKRMFIDPMKTPCCEKTYCNDCITNALIETDFVCPGCQTEGVLIDDLKPDDEAAARIKDYLADKDAKAKRDGTKSPASSPKPPLVEDDKPTEVKAEDARPRSPAPTGTAGKSPQTSTSETSTPAATSAGSAGAEPNARKRPAEELVENPKVPKAPKAMQKAQEAQQQATMMQMMNGIPMDGMNGMSGLNGMNGMTGMTGMTGMNGMNGMTGMTGMPGMPMMPFGNMPMMNGFSGMGMNMNMVNPMMNPMMGGMPGFNMNSSYPAMGGNNMWGDMNLVGGGSMNMDVNGNGGNGMGQGGGFGQQQQRQQQQQQQQQPQQQQQQPQQQQQQQQQHHQKPQQQQQQQPQLQQMMPHRNFQHQPADDDDAYFRKPVNPHRHQNRQRRVRPSDYREL